MKKFIVVLTGVMIAIPLWATAPHQEDVDDDLGILDRVFPADTIDPLKLRFNYLYEFRQIADFCDFWQLDDVDSADHGGMIEAESGDLWDVIQTDNTQEAIWVWCRYGELTGDMERYRDNIGKAWLYCESFPAWQEEGDPGDDYYRNHNCAWGIAAAERYRAVYGDDSYAWYRDSCAEYMKFHGMNLVGTIDRFVTGWCCGWLYRYGIEMGDTEAVDSACAFADRLIEKVSEFPEFFLNEDKWAMSSGTIVWGICESAFKEDPVRGRDWIEQYSPYVDTFQEWKSVTGYDWDVSWNVAYCNGHGAMYDVSGDPQFSRHHKWLTHKLLSYDTDDDGGIPANSLEGDTVDMSWVSTYLCLMGLDRLIGSVPDTDAGVLELVGLYDEVPITPGTVIDLQAVVSNFGAENMTGIDINLSGDASGSGTADLGFLEADTVTLVSNWTVPDSGELTVTISHPGDQQSQNNTLSLGVNKSAPGIGEKVVDRLDKPDLNVTYRSNGSVVVRYNLGNDCSALLSVYSIDGRKIKTWVLNDRQGELVWDGETELVNGYSNGVYFVHLKSGPSSHTQKIVTFDN